MTVLFRTQPEVKAINDFGQKFSDQIYVATIAATTNTQLTVPGGGAMGAMTSGAGSTSRNKMMAVIHADLDVWVAVGATADVPAGASFVKDTSELIMGRVEKAYFVNVGDVLNFYAKGGTTPSISVAFYAMPS